jgi:hypothetical protein
MGSKGSGTGILLKSVDPCLNPRVSPETSPGHDEEERIRVPGRRHAGLWLVADLSVPDGQARGIFSGDRLESPLGEGEAETPIR